LCADSTERNSVADVTVVVEWSAWSYEAQLEMVMSMGFNYYFLLFPPHGEGETNDIRFSVQRLGFIDGGGGWQLAVLGLQRF